MKRFLRNKRGDLDTLEILITTFIAGIFLVAIVYVWAGYYDGIKKTSVFNDPDAQKITEGINNNVYPMFDGVLMFIAFGLMLTNFILVYALKSSPIFLILVFIFTFVEVLVAVPLSNLYVDSISTSATLAPTIAKFTMTGYYMRYLPLWTVLFNVITGVIMYGVGREK